MHYLSMYKNQIKKQISLKMANKLKVQFIDFYLIKEFIVLDGHPPRFALELELSRYPLLAVSFPAERVISLGYSKKGSFVNGKI